MKADLLRNQRGFPLNELYIVIVLQCLILLFAIPNVWNFFYNFRSKPTDCFVKMDSLGSKLKEIKFPHDSAPSEWTKADLKALFPAEDDKDFLRCPETDGSFRLLIKGSHWKLCCPEVENHLSIGCSRSCLIESGWVHDLGCTPSSKPILLPAGILEKKMFSLIQWELIREGDQDFSIKMHGKGYYTILGRLLAVIISLIFVKYLLSSLAKDGTKRPGHKTPPSFGARMISTMNTMYNYISVALISSFIFFLLMGIYIIPQYARIDFKQDNDRTNITMKLSLIRKAANFDSRQIRAIQTTEDINFIWKNAEGKYKRQRIRFKDKNVAREVARMIQYRIGLYENPT